MKYKNVVCLDDIIHNKKVDEFLAAKDEPQVVIPVREPTTEQLAILIDKATRIHYWVKWFGLIYIIVPLISALFTVVAFLLILLA